MATATAEATLPEHVPEALRYDFDISHDPLFERGLHLGLIELNARTPEIFYTTRYGGNWVARSQEAIFDVTQDYETFSSNINKITGFRMMLPIGIDPPEHRDYRKVLLQVFAPKTVNAMLPMIQSMARDLVASVAPLGRCEFVGDVSEAMPVTVFMTIMGIPLDLMVPLRERILVVLEEGDPVRREEIFNEIEEMLNPVLIDKRDNPQDDVISRMFESEVFGRKPTFREMQDYVVFLATAGLDTVTNAMSFTIRHLATDLELQKKVRADPQLIVDMTEEMLRRYAVSSISRTATRDIEFRGVRMKKGDRVHLLLPAANLDSRVYENPEQILLGRTVPPVTFGTGVHRCLGSHLARLELRTVIEEVLRQWPTFTLDPDDPPTESAGLVYSVDRLPLVWTPKE